MKWTSKTWKRAGRTFLQAIVSYIAVNLFVVDFSASKDVIKSALIGLCVSALASGLAGVMNMENQIESEGE